MKIKKYECIMDDGKDVYRVFVTATTKKELKEKVKGNGELVSVKERPEILPSASFVQETLRRNGYGDAECQLVYSVLADYVVGTED